MQFKAHNIYCALLFPLTHLWILDNEVVVQYDYWENDVSEEYIFLVNALFDYINIQIILYIIIIV